MTTTCLMAWALALLLLPVFLLAWALETRPERIRRLRRTGLSQRGYMTASQIMDLENVLREVEAAARAANGGRGEAMVRDPERYFVSIFGTPSTTGAWGWRVEGHHISLHFTVVDGQFVAS